MVSTDIYHVPTTVLDITTPQKPNEAIVLIITVTHLEDSDLQSRVRSLTKRCFGGQV